MPLYRTVITAEWSHVTSVQGLCWSSCLFIAQWSLLSDHTWLASRACADPRASSSHSDHRRVITRDCSVPVLILVPLYCTVINAEWAHVTVQCLCWYSCVFIAQCSLLSDHTWLASSACADPPPSISISRAAGPEIFLLEWVGYLYSSQQKIHRVGAITICYKSESLNQC